MHFDQDGTYNLVYTAEDECGNTTLAERVVEVFTVRTVLYPDGTFIINEKSIDQASNEALHGGTATNVYIPFNPNGGRDVDKYIFASSASRPWNNEATNVISVEVGSAIAPTSMHSWFRFMDNCEEMDLLNVDTSSVHNMRSLFQGCSALVSLDLAHFDTSGVEDMGSMFQGCSALTTIYASPMFDVTNVTYSTYMFSTASRLVGGAGTAYNGNNPRDKTYAHIDGGTSNPGYFTAKA